MSLPLVGSRTSFSAFPLDPALMAYSIPFFFEPNFDAVIKPLAAALRIEEGSPKKQNELENGKKRQPVVYGQFLLGKVSNNFDTGKGKYD